MELSSALELAAQHHQGVLVTLKRDGRPQLSNIAYAFGDDSVIRISVTEGRAKTANLRRDSRTSLYVGRQDFWAYVVLEGDADVSPTASAPDDATVDELADLYRSVQGEHPHWDEFRRAMVADGRLVIRFRPQRAYGMWSDG
jgi:PPOX class probable F420-dependent enzyme